MEKKSYSFDSFLKEKANGMPVWVWLLLPSLTLPLALIINSSAGYSKISFFNTIKFDVLFTLGLTYIWYKARSKQ